MNHELSNDAPQPYCTKCGALPLDNWPQVVGANHCLHPTSRKVWDCSFRVQHVLTTAQRALRLTVRDGLSICRIVSEKQPKHFLRGGVQ